MLSESNSVLSSYVEREGQVEDIVRRLRQSRVLTLTGPSGVGKTQLAGQVLRRAGRSGLPPGGRVANLHELSDRQDVLGVVGAALGLEVATGTTTLQEVSDHIRARRMLLVLDGCEQHARTCAALVGGLLQAAPELHVLATSLQPLGLPGEQIWPVPPLPVPGPRASLTEIAHNPSARLLVDRLSAFRPDFRLGASNAADVAALCRRLDGLPLALELAAAQAALLGLDELARLIDRNAVLPTGHQRGSPPRHQTLAASVAWGWALLDNDEQRLLRRLAVFSGGFSLEAAEAVCADADLPTSSVLDLLNGLAAKSALTTVRLGNTMRYQMLHATRAFVLEQLAETSDLAVFRQRHLVWCIHMAVSQSASSVEAPASIQLEVELDNIRSALEWARQSGADAEGLRLAAACWPLWAYLGYPDGHQWLDQLVASAHLLQPARRAEAACLAAGRAAGQGETQVAIDKLSDAARLAHDAGDRTLESRAHRFQAEVHLRRGDFSAARVALELAQELLVSCEVGLAIHVQARLAIVCLESGDLAGARTYANAARARAGASGRDGLLAPALEVTGALVYREGALDAASTAFTQAIACARSARRPSDEASASIGLLRVHLDRRQTGQARSLLAQLMGVVSEPSVRWLVPQILDAAAELAAPTDAALAARLCGAAEALRERSGSVLWPSEASRRDRWLMRAEAQLGQRLQALWQAGRLLDADDALEEAATVGQAAETQRRAGSEPRRPLSPRERQVAGLLARRLSNRAIGQTLELSEATVRVHVAHVLSKLGVRSRTQVSARMGVDQDGD